MRAGFGSMPAFELELSCRELSGLSRFGFRDSCRVLWLRLRVCRLSIEALWGQSVQVLRFRGSFMFLR